MAFSIARTFSTMKQSSRSKTTTAKGLILNILYAQGIPVLITLTTFLMDTYGPCDTTRPNMGKYQCFLGSEQFQGDSFFQSAEFLYYYLIVAIIIVTNLIFFTITGFSLCKHWYQMKNIQSSSGDGKTKQFWIVLKLSIIMGIPWICDIISAWLFFESGARHTFAIRLCLDIINLLTGILIFTVLVGFNPFFTKIRERTRLSYTKSTSLSTRKSSGLWRKVHSFADPEHFCPAYFYYRDNIYILDWMVLPRYLSVRRQESVNGNKWVGRMNKKKTTDLSNISFHVFQPSTRKSWKTTQNRKPTQVNKRFQQK